jgi:hypothetical protein
MIRYHEFFPLFKSAIAGAAVPLSLEAAGTLRRWVSRESD